MREEGPQHFEATIKNVNNLQKDASQLKDEVQASLQTPTDLLSDILKCLTLEDKNFKLLLLVTTMK